MTDAEFAIALDLAGITFRVTVEGAAEAAHIEARFGPFRAPDPDAPDAIELRVAFDPALAVPQPVGVPYPAAVGVAGPDGAVVYERWNERLVWEPAARRARCVRSGATPRPTRPPVVESTSIDTPLRLLLSHQLVRAGGLLLHGAGFADARGAVVFLAPDGGGKTTTAHKLPPAGVLGDDQVGVRWAGGAFRACALPFVGRNYGRSTAPREAPLRAVVLLAKSPTDQLRPMARPTALARLLSCAPSFVRDDDEASRLLETAARLLAVVPAYELQVSRDGPIVPHLDVLLAR